GAIQNISATEGQTATVEVTFYDAAGAVMGVEQAMVQIPATDAQAAFRVEVDTEQYVGGYSYEITL
ncbi:MAG TPA: FxLYD domain-containing protein, partial [bacterium]|nr:FxLYD domain-containing protein [bacterium]